MKKLTKEEIIKGHIANKMTNPIALEAVRLGVLESLKKYPADSYVSAAQLVLYERWLKMDRGERSRFGQRLSLLVEINELPLVRAKSVGKTKHYLTI